MAEIVLKVGGMTCNGCARNVADILKDLAGVDAVDVNLEKAQADVRFDDSRITVKSMAAAITEAGYEVAV